MQHERTACEAAEGVLKEITVGEPSDVTEGP